MTQLMRSCVTISHIFYKYTFKDRELIKLLNLKMLETISLSYFLNILLYILFFQTRMNRLDYNLRD